MHSHGTDLSGLSDIGGCNEAAVSYGYLITLSNYKMSTYRVSIISVKFEFEILSDSISMFMVTE
jgi:uncharacterized membrane protein YciS (DUF1049 family)